MGDRQRITTALPAIDVLVEAGAWPAPTRLRRIADRVIAAAVSGAKPKLAPSSEVSIVFTDDAHVRRLNRTYRAKDKATNVLSFPGSDARGRAFGPLLGDIVLGFGVVAKEALAEGIALEDHLAHLVVHGFLHLVGHDHMEDDEATVMENLETAILATLGIADPYAGKLLAPARRTTRQAAVR